MQKFWIQACTVVAVVGMLGVYNVKVDARKQAEKEAKAAYDLAMQEQNETASEYTDGTYEGEAEGFGGPVKVQVTVEQGQITAIDVLSHTQEDDAYYNSAVAVIDEMLEEQTTEVDTVSGATFSSNGIIGAVEDALGKAK